MSALKPKTYVSLYFYNEIQYSKRRKERVKNAPNLLLLLKDWNLFDSNTYTNIAKYSKAFLNF